jgi:hypothetical protein
MFAELAHAYDRAVGTTPVLTIEFSAAVWYWRGPSPFHFVSIPQAETEAIQDIAQVASYGWGMIPLDVTIGRTTFYTAAFAKDGLYALPLKVAVRRAEGIELGDVVKVIAAVRPRK